MGKLVAVVGNLGAGKTTLTRLLCEQAGFTPYWEKPEEHPFQQLLAQEARTWYLANQMDFFLTRCQQEQQVRQGDGIAVTDGGFDQDFHVFTKNLRDIGHLSADEFGLCERFYQLARSLLPAPDLLIRVVLDTPTLLQRRLARGRKTFDWSYSAQELDHLELLLDDWLAGETRSPLIRFPFEQPLLENTAAIDGLVIRIKDILQGK